MFFKGEAAAMSKFDYAATLVASLAWLLHKQRDAVGLTLFDSELRLQLPPRASYSHFRQVVEAMEKATPGADTGLGQVLKKVGMQIRRRGLVVVVSDFVANLAGFGEALGLHDGEGNEVVLFRIEDPDERLFPYRGAALLRGMENEGELLCDPRDLRNSYLAARERHVQALYQSCRRHGFMVEDVPTDAPLDGMLSGFLNLRSALFRR
jgi:uncharacterized protein (DUF58 family)